MYHIFIFIHFFFHFTYLPTFLGVEVKFKNCHYPVLIQPTNIPEMTSLTSGEHGVRVGAAVTLSNFEKYIAEEIKEQPGKFIIFLFRTLMCSVPTAGPPWIDLT